MTAAPAMTLPGSRVILGWWRELTGSRPVRLWYAHLLLYRVEVLVESARTSSVTGLAQSLLPLLSRQGGPFRPEAVAAELHLDPGLLGELLGELARMGQARATEDRWEVLRAGAGTRNAAGRTLERRSFSFSDGSSSGCSYQRPDMNGHWA